MDLVWQDAAIEARFLEYVDGLSPCLDHADRIDPFKSYCKGLLLPGKRKSVEPMAARLRPDRTSAMHQSMLHFVGQAAWDEAALLRNVREAVLPVMTTDEPIQAWIIDDSGLPKKGRHSVGVSRQYCGQVGKQDNCQVAVSLSVATSRASLPVGLRLYLPQNWADDEQRRAKAKVPETVKFASKPEIALELVNKALSQGISRGTVLSDSGHGHSSDFRDGVTALGLDYCVGVLGNQLVWPPGVNPRVPAKSRRGRPPKRLRREGDGAKAIQIKALAKSLPAEDWREVNWREGVAEPLTSRFAALRVRSAHGKLRPGETRPEQWLLIEWPKEEKKPTKFWLSTVPADTPIERLVYLAKLRWMIERDYQELKQEVGFGHYEGRGWPGFHHHAALCIAAYGFLVAERARIPPSAAKTTRLVQVPALPESYRPRGSPSAHGTPCAILDSITSKEDRKYSGEKTTTMSVLRQTCDTERKINEIFMTQ